MQISVADYVERMKVKGYFSANQKIPELNSDVWKSFLQITEAHVSEVNHTAIYWLVDKYGFYYNPFGAFENLEWALCSYFCHSHFPYQIAELVNDTDKIITALQTQLNSIVIKTDTFTPSNEEIQNSNYLKYLLWLNSPVVSIETQYKKYLASLTSSRRNKIKKVTKDYNEKKIITQLSFETIMPSEWEFVLTNLARKWNSEKNYAITQFFWAVAVSQVMPEQVFWLRVYENNKLIALSFYIIKEDILYHQGIVKDETLQLHNIGTFCFLETIRPLCGTRYTSLDPTCKTSFIETESIEGYKRSVVNMNAIKPIYLVCEKDNPFFPGVPFYSENKGWVLSDDKVILSNGI